MIINGSTSGIYKPILLSSFSSCSFWDISSFVMICSAIIFIFTVLMPECVFRSFSDWLIGDSCHPIGLLVQFDLEVLSLSWFSHLYACVLYVNLPAWWVIHPRTLLFKFWAIVTKSLVNEWVLCMSWEWKGYIGQLNWSISINPKNILSYQESWSYNLEEFPGVITNWCRFRGEEIEAQLSSEMT